MFEYKQDGEYRILVRYNGTDEVVTIPKNVEVIGKNAFYKKNITKVFIPKEVKWIEEKAFFGCKDLREIVFLDKHCHISIGHKSFSHCSSLNNVTLPYGVTDCDDSFEHCKKLKCIHREPTPKTF